MSGTWSNQQKIVAGVLIAAVVILAGLLLSVTMAVHNVGRITTIGFSLWADSNMTTRLTQIDWGNLNPGDTHGVVAWAQNTQSANFTLSYLAYNWNPTSAAQYLLFSWNYTGQVLHGGDSLPIQMTLLAYANVTGITTFSFDLNMTATQV